MSIVVSTSEGVVSMLVDEIGEVLDAQWVEVVKTELDVTIARFVAAGKTVYLIEDRPDFPFDPSGCRAGNLGRLIRPYIACD